MAPAVIPDQVSSIRNKTSQIRLLAGVPTDQKERRLDPVFGQQIEQLRRPGWIRPVVEGERNLPSPRGRNECRSKKSRSGGHGGIGASARRQPRGRQRTSPFSHCFDRFRDHLLPVCGPFHLFRNLLQVKSLKTSASPLFQVPCFV